MTEIVVEPAPRSDPPAAGPAPAVHIAGAHLNHRASRMGVVLLLAMVAARLTVQLLFEATTATAAGNHAHRAEAESRLLEMAEAGGVSFEVDLVAAVADRLMRDLPGASREEAERAVAVDVLRHVERARRLAGVEPWGHA
jgi:hypothetical protein